MSTPTVNLLSALEELKRTRQLAEVLLNLLDDASPEVKSALYEVVASIEDATTHLNHA